VRRLITQAVSDLMMNVYQKVREGHRFDLLERCFQNATERKDNCLNHFKNILKKREIQSTLDRFSTSLAKRQRPATEEEETYLE